MTVHGDKPRDHGPGRASTVRQIFAAGTSSVRQRRPRALTAGALIAALAMAAAAGTPGVGPLITLSAWLTGAALVLMLAFPDARPGAIAGAAGAGSLAATLAFQGPADNRTAGWWLAESVAAAVVLHLVVRRADARPAALAGVVAAVAVTVLPLRLTLHVVPPASPRGAVLGCLFCGLGAAVAAGTGLYLRWLDARRSRSVAEARRAQRLDLARDLHDFVAHEVGGMIVQAQAAQLGGDPAAALRRIEAAGARAMASLDRTVHMLHDDGPRDGPHGLDDLPALVDRFSTSDGARARLTMEDVTPPPEVSATAYRLVVEALTNVRRHAPGATAVEVSVTATGPHLRVAVTDDGPGGRTGRRRERRRGGLGLPGTAERVEALGGDFRAGPAGDRGWRVIALIPLRSPP
ncbi:sensor histidine kinase [Actinomadura geliboluensis]|uniref:sensor histidine kinase n=1 Tax=Actinomadura geliboluensis TaxID=882440 RepID=UPI0026219E61|nr:ATP-binding protein [Actinomadura geliboluensis]